MERRNRSLEALERLNYIDSLEDEDSKAQMLEQWYSKYLDQTSIEEFDLESDELNKLSELMYKNINFLKQHRDSMKEQIDNYPKIKKFLN